MRARSSWSRRGDWDTLTEAALNYAEAEAPEDFALARDRLRKASLRYGVTVLYRQDREVRVRVWYVRPRRAHPCQLCLWPARTKA